MPEFMAKRFPILVFTYVTNSKLRSLLKHLYLKDVPNHVEILPKPNVIQNSPKIIKC